MIKRFWGVTCLTAFLLSSCAGPGKIPSKTQPPVKEATLLSKTSGEVVSEGGLAGDITYKDIRVAINPIRDLGASVDYVLFTGASFQDSGLRKNQKIIAPPQTAAILAKKGFSSVKGLRPGTMVQLSKNGGFVFVRAIQGKSSEGTAVNGYMLEFDNGRNLFLGGANADVDAYRQFLYSLRDEGKEIHMAFLYGSLEESKILEVVPLLQPQVAVLVGDKFFSKKEIDGLRQKLQEQLFDGSLFAANPSDKFPF